MQRIFVTGTGTEVGKTVVSSLIINALHADYWKPIQSGDLHHSDSQKVAQWSGVDLRVHPEVYRLNSAVSPHLSAALDGVALDLERLRRTPASQNNLMVVEGAGGLMVPIDSQHFIMDLILPKDKVILVSRHYLGSINHTLLSAKMLKMNNIDFGIIWVGKAQPSTEQLIENHGIRCLFRLDEWDEITPENIRLEARKLKPFLYSFLND